MITLHILQLLQDDGLGIIDTDLFWEKLPLNKEGVAILSRGGELFRGRSKAVQAFDLYSRGASDIESAKKLEILWQYFVTDYQVCDLPTVPGRSDAQYKNARFTPIANLENLGADETDRIIFRLSCEVIYDKV